MSKPLKATLLLLAFCTCVALVVVIFPSTSKFPDIVKGRPTESIMEFGKFYWQSLSYEEKRTFLEGYMMGLMSATMQVTVFHNVPHDDLKHIAMLDVSSSFVAFQIDKAYLEENNEEKPLFRVLYQENLKERSR